MSRVLPKSGNYIHIPPDFGNTLLGASAVLEFLMRNYSWKKKHVVQLINFVHFK